MNPTQVIAYTRDAPTKIRGEHFDLRTGQTRTFPGGTLPYHRKSITITNLDAGSRLYVIKPQDARPGGDSTPTDVVRILTVFPPGGTGHPNQVTLHASDDVTIAAADEAIDVTGKAGAVQILEVFYV